MGHVAAVQPHARRACQALQKGWQARICQSQSLLLRQSRRKQLFQKLDWFTEKFLASHIAKDPNNSWLKPVAANADGTPGVSTIPCYPEAPRDSQLRAARFMRAKWLTARQIFRISSTLVQWFQKRMWQGPSNEMTVAFSLPNGTGAQYQVPLESYRKRVCWR